VVIRRLAALVRPPAAVVPLLLLAIVGPGAPASADQDPAVTVAATSPGQVVLAASVDAASSTRAPAVTVSSGGRTLPATAQVVQAAASPAEARAVVVVLDTSGSMAGPPLEAARAAVLGFAAAVPADLEIGLVAVADEPKVLVRPTRNRAAVRTALSATRAGGQTALYDGLRRAADLVRSYPERRLLVLSDGEDTVSGGDIAAVASGLAATGARVDVVAFRTDADGLDRLRRLTRATGGQAFESAGQEALAGAFRSAAATYRLRLSVAVTVPAELAGSSATLTVTVGSGATARRSTVPVTFAAAGPPPATRAPAPSPLLQPWLLAVLVFAGLLTLALFATAPMRRPVGRERLEQVDRFRLAAIGAATAAAGGTGASATGAAGTAGGAHPRSALTRAVLDLSQRMVRPGAAEDRLTLQLERAGMAMRPHEWIALRSATCVAGALLFGVFGGLTGLLLGALLGWLAPGLYRRFRQSRRTRAFTDQLPDALQLVVGSLKSGFSLGQAIDAVTRDLTTGPLTAEFSRALAETRLGADLSDALERVARRVGNDDLGWAVMAVRIQRDTGGNLAEILQTTVDTLRERDRLRRHVQALSAEGRLSGYILVAMPIVLAGWMFMVRRDYLRLLWTTPPGLILLLVGIGLIVVGAFWMSRWVKVEV
jgi:tight adherence protein B